MLPPVKMTMFLNLKIAYASTAVLRDNKAELIGPTRTFPIPWQKQRMAYVATSADGSSLTALPIPTLKGLNADAKKPYTMLKKMSRPRDFAKPHIASTAMVAMRMWVWRWCCV